jgi:hypothetical protein
LLPQRFGLRIHRRHLLFGRTHRAVESEDAGGQCQQPGDDAPLVAEEFIERDVHTRSRAARGPQLTNRAFL